MNFFRDALEMPKKQFYPIQNDHTDLADILNGIGWLYGKQGESYMRIEKQTNSCIVINKIFYVDIEDNPDFEPYPKISSDGFNSVLVVQNDSKIINKLSLRKELNSEAINTFLVVVSLSYYVPDFVLVEALVRWL
jgi:hypothetical protein